jgi:hypothetical protein
MTVPIRRGHLLQIPAMNVSLIRPLILGVFLFPAVVIGQQAGAGQSGVVVANQPITNQLVGGQPDANGVPQRYSDPANTFVSNVPINELNARAYRRFHRRFQSVTAGECWFKSGEGYQVSFMLDQHRELAYYDLRGAFMYSVKYYDAKEAPRETGDLVNRRYPDYKIDVVTEIWDGQKTFYLVQILNRAHIKILSVTDGRIEIVQEMNNGGVDIGPAQANAR